VRCIPRVSCSITLLSAPTSGVRSQVSAYPPATLSFMTDKKQDATKNLEPDEPTQETEKGLKIGVPKRDEFLAGLEKSDEPEK